MAWHKQKQYDPTEAFIQNERQQKLLDLELERIDKLWYQQMKLLSRDRLETTSELIRLEDEKSQLEYFDDSMDIHDMKDYIDNFLTHMKSLKRELTHDNFNFYDTGAMHLKRMIHQNGKLTLPKVDNACFVTQSVKPKKNKKPIKNRAKRRRKSNLFKSKILSVSDSNLEKISKCRQEKRQDDIEQSDIEGYSDVETQGEKQKVRQQLPVLPSKQTVKKMEPHRYLKERMATTLVLPTVTEIATRERKLSI